MLSYKEYKELNESLYGLGIKQPNIIGLKGTMEETCGCSKMSDSPEEVPADSVVDMKDMATVSDSDSVATDSPDVESPEQTVEEEPRTIDQVVSDVEKLVADKDPETVEKVKAALETIRELLGPKEEMTEDEKKWWTSVNGQLSAPGDIGFAPVGKLIQHLR